MIYVYIIFVIFLSIINQIIFWKFFKPKNTGLTLIIILILSNIFYMYLLSFLINFDSNYYPLICLAILSFDLMYLFAYPAIEFPSPSVELIGLINSQKNFDIEKFISKKKSENVIQAKIKQLINEKYIFSKDDKYSLTFKGKILIKFFIFYKIILNQKKGG